MLRWSIWQTICSVKQYLPCRSCYLCGLLFLCWSWFHWCYMQHFTRRMFLLRKSQGLFIWHLGEDLMNTLKHCFPSVHLNTAETNNRLSDLLPGLFLCVSSGAWYRVKITVKHLNGTTIWNAVCYCEVYCLWGDNLLHQFLRVLKPTQHKKK